MKGDPGRWALYFAPDPKSLLARFGSSWLGYDATSATAVTQPRLAGIAPERLAEITAEPRHYGFHATLKPPFALAEDCDEAAIEAAVARLAGGFPAFDAPPLRLGCLAGFWALILSRPSLAMQCLAALCLEQLDAFRAPASEAELARRRQTGLSPRQNELLQRWGYPYVLDEFRFHMTLTARIERAEGEAVQQALEPLIAPLCRASLPVDAISLFRQQNHDAPFRLVRRYPLAAG